uniref:Uncharacterized protein n=1 Tax=Ciona intestinalis TaxID=7719 RepID=H2Y3V1_CIOIN
MKFHILSFLLLILSVRKSASVLNQIRWCDTSIDNTTQVWKSYNDSTSACVKCGSIYRLFEDRSQVDTSCCVGGAFTGTRCSVPCGGVTVACQNQNTFCVNTPQQSCDGYNDCGDGTDEIKLSQITPGCTQCENNQFQCKMVSIFPQCFPRSKVCDGVKNCVAGSDEINCLYHGGRCRGFLCTNIPQCIAENEVCNGHKDCYDGSDEKKEKKEKNKEGYTNVLPKSKKEEPQLTNGSASNKHQATLNGSPFHEYGKLSPVVSPSDKYPDQNETHYDVIFRDSLQSQHNGNDNREGFL